MDAPPQDLSPTLVRTITDVVLKLDLTTESTEAHGIEGFAL
ncbi:MAG: hypothetical protein OQK71_07885 [Desulfobacter sp.]|nr:hypothetical protein [Desulfobacter sp.]